MIRIDQPDLSGSYLAKDLDLHPAHEASGRNQDHGFKWTVRFGLARKEFAIPVVVLLSIGGRSMVRGSQARISGEARLARIAGTRASDERRGEKRHIALLRVALLHAGGIRDLCVVKNISSAGLAARVYRQLPDNDMVRIEFRSGEMLSGSVVWQHDGDVGIQFPTPIDIDSVLASRWVTDGRRRNLPRIDLSCRGQLRKGAVLHDVVLQDISQGGARVHIESPLDRGSIVLSLPGLPALAGVVQWASGTDAGISFNECISFDPLARWIQAHRSAASVE